MKSIRFLLIPALLALASCEGDKPEGPGGSGDWLLSTIYEDDFPRDSFVYTSNQQIGRIYHNSLLEQSFGAHLQFDYNASGQCIRVRNITRENKLNITDTLVYGNGGISVTRHYHLVGIADNTQSFKFSNDGITLVRSKDTIYGNGGKKNVDYAEFIYTAGNLATLNWVRYEESIIDDGVTDDYKLSTFFEYDNQPNGLANTFKNNPYAAYIFHAELTNPTAHVAIGKHNLTGYRVRETIRGSSQENVTEMRNTYDPVTGFVRTQEVEWNMQSLRRFHFRYQQAK